MFRFLVILSLNISALPLTNGGLAFCKKYLSGLFIIPLLRRITLAVFFVNDV